MTTNFPIKVFHTADIQIEVRNTQQRSVEYEYILNFLAKEIQKEESELYIIAGDIFETCRPNDTERMIFINHLKKVIEFPKLKEIIICHGNHDVDQRKESNYFLGADGYEPSPNSLDSIVKAIGSDKIILLGDSKIYQSHAWKDLNYIVWSQKTKHSSILEDSYNPISELTKLDNDKTYVTIYHDPINGCMLFDGKKLANNDKLEKLDAFVTKTIFAGDIHQPQIVKHNDKKLIYPGSPVPRNFGEGDYYENGKLVIDGNIQHPYFTCLLLQDGSISNEKWVSIPQFRTYSTFIVNNDIQPNMIDSLNFKIENTGLCESLIKVKLPSATESWLSLQQHIIDLVREQNKNVNFIIQILYGKSISDNDTELPKLSNTKEIISNDKLLSVAKEYIHTQVQNSKSIPVDDKKSIEEKIYDIFLNEINEINTNVVSNVIHFNSLKLSNFMAFGDNINIDFSRLNGLTKLTGGNGIGKTTLYKAIKWVITGYISQSQNKTRKNENNLAVFNDYRHSCDNVTVELNMTINEKDFTVIRTVNRSWKKNAGVEERSSKIWKQYISDTTSSISVIGEDKTYAETEAELFLQKVFDGLENLERIVFADQFTLKNFVCSEPQRLCEEILSHIGMDFFNRMYDKYEEVRTKYLSGISKPSSTIEQLNNEISSFKEEINKKQLEKEQLGNELSELLNKKNSIENEIDSLNKEIIPGLSKESIEEKKKTIEDDIATIDKSIFDLKRELTSIKECIKTVEKEDLETKITQEKEHIASIESEIKRLEKVKNEANIEIKELEKEILERKRQITDENANYNLELNNKLLEKIHTQTKISEKKNELQTQINDIINNKLNECKIEITKCDAKIEQITTIKKQQEELLESMEKQISDYKSSEICPTCKRRLDEHSLEEINNAISELETKKLQTSQVISNCEIKIKEFENIKESYNRTIGYIKTNEYIPDECKPLNEMLNKCNTLSDNITKEHDELRKLLDEHSEKVKELLETDEKIKHNETRITSLSNNISDTYVPQIDYEETKLEESKEKLQEMEQMLKNYNENKLAIATKENQIYSNELRKSSNETALKSISLDYENLKKNEELEKSIIEKKSEIENIQNEINAKQKEKEGRDVSIAVYENAIENRKTDIESVIKYRILETALKQYKALIGKSGLPQYIFTLVKPLLNSKLNDLLEDLNFRLQFNEYNQLVMIDISKPNSPNRYPSQFSGMQTCFAGLSLLFVNRMCNNTFIFDSLFIDEISGQLNSGEDLQYESLNYQEQLKKLLSKFTGMNIWIVDHVIQEMNENNLLEVLPTINGAYVKQIK